MIQGNRTVRSSSNSLLELVETVAITLAVTGIFYYCYYLLAPWIWSQNIPYHPDDITPWVLGPASEHDGIEIYALYILVFVNSITALFFSGLVRIISGMYMRRILVALCAAVGCIYCATIDFIPPMNSFQTTSFSSLILISLSIMTVVFSLVALLHFLYMRSPYWSLAMAALVLVPVCFIATSPISWLDYTYIFSPALRLLKGFAIRDIYFQYDLLPSLLAAVWMKLDLDLNTFQVLGQAAYYLIILGVFIFSGKLFQKKELSIFLLAAIVLGRIYASPWDPVVCFQVTPFRLDLWFPLLIVVYCRGAFHWSAGLVCGLLILLLKNFGIIYTLSYIQLLATLFAIRYSDSDNRSSLPLALLEYVKTCTKPLAIIMCSSAVSYFLFKNSEYPNYAGFYQKIGIGFIQIASNSFYWYVPAVISMAVILLIRLRNRVSPAYLATGLLLTYCAIGNSIYFFGRSHEHNILNISIVLIFLFFLVLDLISQTLNREGTHRIFFPLLQRHGVVVIAIIFIGVISLYYAQNITKKIVTQATNVSNGQTIYPIDVDWTSFNNYISEIKQVTSHSSNVFFAMQNDFGFNYYGGYTPISYCSPFLTWIFANDLNKFLQNLLDAGYFLVFSPDMQYQLAKLQYTNKNNVNEFAIVSKLPLRVQKP